MNESPRQLVIAGTVLGIGMGGFMDGIALHQLLQVHHLLTTNYPTRGVAADQLVINLQINMFWDGLFHLMAWLTTAAGLGLLWRAVSVRGTRQSGRTLLGAMILGWGLFNVVEGVIDHHILHIHHVTESADHLTWDLTFLASGAAMICLGWLMLRGHKARPDAASAAGAT